MEGSSETNGFQELDTRWSGQRDRRWCSERLAQNKDFGELQLLVNEQILDKSMCRKGQSRVEQQAGTDSLRM